MSNTSLAVPAAYMVPIVVEQTNRGERASDIYSMAQPYHLGTPIDDTVANLVVGQLLFLAQDDAGATSSCTSTVRAGPIDAGLAIYDTMHLIQPQVATTVAGVAASTAAWLLAGGATGKRSALPNQRILIHQASSGFQGTAGYRHPGTRATTRATTPGDAHSGIAGGGHGAAR
jgi:ATP-dependent Clp protease protease subunit